jgi:uncharacterized protein (TIGR03000 family)
MNIHFDSVAKSVLGLLTLGAAISASQVATAQCRCGGSAAYSGMATTTVTPEMPLPAGQIIESDSIYLTVVVPEQAILKINNDPTISVGTIRYFVVRNLEIGRSYDFKIVAETANAANVAMEETKSVTLTPGSAELVTLKPTKRKVEPSIN